jgi:hypothetical protein
MVLTRQACPAVAAVLLLASILTGMTALNAQASRLRGVNLPPLAAGIVDGVLESSNGSTRFMALTAYGDTAIITDKPAE